MDTILFYTPGTCSLACMVALEWLGEPYRLCRVDKELRGGPLYKLINPHAQVPAMQVDGRVLLETNAILAHIADRTATGALLASNGSWERDVANQWLAYLASGFHPVFWPFFSPQRYVQDGALHDAVRASAVEAIGRELRFVNAHLDGKDFVSGEARSVLDAYLYAMDRWANKLVNMAKDYPNVWRHQKLLAKDAGVRFATGIERGDEVAPGGAFTGHVELAALVSAS
jgi:glutathione S-transferase